MLPVVESRAAKMLGVELKPQRPHQPQPGPRCQACAADIPRVLWNLGLVQYDVQQGSSGQGIGRRCERLSDGWRLPVSIVIASRFRFSSRAAHRSCLVAHVAIAVLYRVN